MPSPLPPSLSLSPDPLCHLWLRQLSRRCVMNNAGIYPLQPTRNEAQGKFEGIGAICLNGPVKYSELSATSSETWITLPILVLTCFSLFALPTIACLHLNMSANLRNIRPRVSQSKQVPPSNTIWLIPDVCCRPICGYCGQARSIQDSGMGRYVMMFPIHLQ
jgi:hypothetical protein